MEFTELVKEGIQLRKLWKKATEEDKEGIRQLQDIDL